MLRRNLLLGERIMYVNAQTPVNCTFTAAIRGHLNLGNLRQALAKLQARHPLLQASIQEDTGGRPYFVSDSQTPPIPIRVVQCSSDVAFREVTEAEWATPLEIKKGPLMRLVWLRSPSLSELMIVCAHCICDGATIIMLMRELLAFLDQPHRQMTACDDFHCIEEIVSGAAAVPKTNVFRTTFRSLVTRIVFALKPSRECAPRGRDYLLHWKLNRKATSQLAERCKAEGVTVFAALCVTFLIAFSRVKAKSARNQVICPVDIRKKVPEIKEDMMFAFAPIIRLSVDNTPTLSFWDKVRQLKADITEKVAALNAYEQLQAGEQYHSIVRKVLQYLLSEEGDHDFTFSNMGRLDLPEAYRTFQLESIYSANVAFPWKNPTTLVISTFDGLIDFAFVSNTSFLSYEEAITLKGKGLALLLEELLITRAF